MCHYYRFLLGADEQELERSEQFYREFSGAIPKCGEIATVNLYTTPDYRERILTEKLQRVIVECSDDALPALGRLLEEFPATEVTPPDGEALLCILGTSKQAARRN